MSELSQAVSRRAAPEGRRWRPSRRLWIGTLAALALATLALGGGQMLQRLDDGHSHPVRRVAVDGPLEHTDREALQEVVVRFSGEGFYRADLQALRQALLGLPWVRRVAIRRIWPDRLSIHLLEHQPVAVWNAEALLSARGVVFRPDPAQTERVAARLGLPRLAGPPGQAAAVWAAYAAWAEELGEAGLRLVEVERNRRGAWRLGLGDGPSLLLGRQEMGARLRRWLDVQQGGAALPLHRIERVDLRYTNGFAIGWKPEAADRQS